MKPRPTEAAWPLHTRPPLTGLRDEVRSHLSPLADRYAVEDTLLALSELVTNAYMHTDSPQRLEVKRLDDTIRVSVTDGNPRPPVPQPPDDERPHGRGMQIVAAVSKNWESEPTASGGKTVHAEIPAPQI